MPELSPAFGNTQIPKCNWIGGIDLNADNDGSGQGGQRPAATVLLSLSKKMRVIRIGEDPRALRVGSIIRVELSHTPLRSLLTYVRPLILLDVLYPFGGIQSHV